MRNVVATAYSLAEPDTAVILVETDENPNKLVGYELLINRVPGTPRESDELWHTDWDRTSAYNAFKDLVFG